MTGLWEAPVNAFMAFAAARPGMALDPVPEPDDVTPGWWGFLCVVALFAATFLLWLSMRKQLRRIDFDDGSDDPADDAADDPSDGASDGPELATPAEAAPAVTPAADPDEPPAPERP